MLFSRSWLAEYVDLPGDIDELADGLTAVGLNVETIEERGDDVALDLEVTPNRTDCMNHLGVAREVAVKFDRSLRRPAVEDPGSGEVGVSIRVDDLADCPRYVGVAVEGVGVGPSPDWLVDRLESIGVRSINNVVDVTNFVLWERGQPLHAFDLDTLAGEAIVVRRAREGESLTTLDDVERRLDSEVLVIADAERAVALAGVMGGTETEVTEATTTVLIESAHFNPTLVRKAASRLGMHTDASHRFERGTDPGACTEAALRAAHLLAEVAGGTVRPGIVDVRDQNRCWNPQGDLDHQCLQDFGGVEVAADEVERILAGLGYAAEKSDGGWRVAQPSWRYYDQEAFRQNGPRKDGQPPEMWPADLYEEVLRVVGFDDIPATLPRISQPDAGASRSFLADRSLRHRLAGQGFVETISYSFQSQQDCGTFASLLAGAEPVEVRNPVSESFRWMRRSMLPGLVEAARFNQRHGAEVVELFELGHVFAADGREIDVLGVVAGGVSEIGWDRDPGWDFFALKGAIEPLLHGDARFEAAEVLGFREGTAARIVDASGEVIGHLGEVDDPDLAYPLFGAELAVSAIARPVAEAVTPPSMYPAITADITFTHAEAVAWSEIAEVIESARVEELSGFGLKVRYRGEGVPEGAVNTTVWFRYNADDRSLTQDEVNEFQDRTRSKLEEEFGWQPKTNS